MYISVLELEYSELHGLEFGYVLEGDLGMIERVGEWLPPGAVSLGDSSDPWRGDYVVGLSQPLLAGVAIPFVTWEFKILSETGIVGFRLGPADTESIPDGRPACEIGGAVIPLRVVEGRYACVDFHSCIRVWGNFSAVFGDQPVAEHSRSFGSVKCLFR